MSKTATFSEFKQFFFRRRKSARNVGDVCLPTLNRDSSARGKQAVLKSTSPCSRTLRVIVIQSVNDRAETSSFSSPSPFTRPPFPFLFASTTLQHDDVDIWSRTSRSWQRSLLANTTQNAILQGCLVHFHRPHRASSRGRNDKSAVRRSNDRGSQFRRRTIINEDE